jgi:predicted Zn-dependent peptidase
VNYAVQTQSANQVLFAHYDMVQAEINWARNIEPYNTADYPTIQLYNNYFGGSMAGIVFQTIRESKALAYSTYALIPTPNSKEYPFTYRAYVGTQADKLDDAIRSMNELINTTPDAEKTLAAAKVSIKKDIETDRVMDENVIFTYLAAKRLGLDYDIRKNVYNQIDNIGYAEVKKYADQYIAGKPYTYCIVASDKRVKTDDLKKYGEVKVLTLQEIFGY